MCESISSQEALYCLFTTGAVGDRLGIIVKTLPYKQSAMYSSRQLGSSVVSGIWLQMIAPSTNYKQMFILLRNSNIKLMQKLFT